ncbi:major Facilitator Superfamily protein [Burkholderia ambifaria AMMD]|uniref:Major facilitator superfamily MFS_1 n=1 Tax=Burkholderia ambifaria (strain ATCC BAA-244 / DSM 16087 / CCUG 44356 / LMG 19182 / AMMD) TaxID=339670 RepID=Q0BEA9_BURCM|nr:MFS transporter [Burkholderia ambifaria]ABI87514.1 major facilitator superfamily MFS_1 [Burkholderia ambifaria AMMD]AJY20564.1 major Facilitator Superfamily protein [Burkholderia ambifaria AMMD]MBR7929004.1 MFS transporter [Burkholderia ambifaria]PEH65281.1 MFS transporter [Burkholderia ambifaria]QQC05277.1 MFS transporter [Burkholderia ambifaria]
MPDSRYRWVIVAAGGLMGCIAIGAMFSLPVFLRAIARDTGWSMTGISGAMTLGFLAMAFASIGWGSLSDRIGTRAVVVTGAVLLSASVALASRAPSLLAFQLIFGLAVGSATAAVFAPMMACVTGWFDTHRSLAVSLVSAGMGMAPMTMSPLAAWLVSGHGWRTSMLAIAALAAVVMIPASLLVRRAPALDVTHAGPLDGPTPAGGSATAPLSVGGALRSPQFLVLLLTNFFCCATHSGPIFHTVSYAVTCGIPLIAAVSIYSVEGLAGMGGRIAFGLLGDRLGAKRMLVAGLLAQALGALGYYFVRTLDGFYVVATLFGFIYAGVMPLYAVLARENFPLRMMGTVIGGCAMAGSLGMAAGPVAGGLIVDALGSYGWLYLGSFAIGIGAFLVAMMFRPFPKERSQPIAA